jgi:hypothetical protein
MDFFNTENRIYEVSGAGIIAVVACCVCLCCKHACYRYREIRHNRYDHDDNIRVVIQSPSPPPTPKQTFTVSSPIPIVTCTPRRRDSITDNYIRELITDYIIVSGDDNITTEDVKIKYNNFETVEDITAIQSDIKSRY